MSTVCCKPEAEVRRFTNFKWLVAALLLLLLLISWLGFGSKPASGPAVSTAASMASAGSGGLTSSSAVLALQADSKQVIVSGHAPDASTKAAWLGVAATAFAGRSIVDQIVTTPIEGTAFVAPKVNEIITQVGAWGGTAPAGISIGDGTVVLTGVVADEAEKQRRGQWAQTLFGTPIKLDNRLVVDANALKVSAPTLPIAPLVQTSETLAPSLAPAVTAPAVVAPPAPAAAPAPAPEPAPAVVPAPATASPPPAATPASAPSSSPAPEVTTQKPVANVCSAEPAALAPVYFGTKSARVTPKALAQLRQLAKCNPGKQIELIGHTDERGDEASNLRLSEMRAKSVARQLERAGIAGGQIKFSGKGEAEPAQTGKGPAVWAKNRRVEVRLL